MRINALLGLALLCAPAALTAASVDDTLATGRKALFNDGVATAWKLAQQALAEAPQSAAAHEFSGEVLFRRGDFAGAETEFRSALKVDKNLALAWWGLARVADCMSLHKTAAQYFRQAHELDPRDPRIFADWALRLQGQPHIDALEKYASMADPSRNPAELAGLREHIQFDKALNGRDLMVLASNYEKTEIPLLALVVNHQRSYGLEVRVNGNPLTLVLDTGASGILLSPKASQNIGIARLAAGTVRGFGNNTQPTGGYRGLADRVRIGDVEFRNALITVSGQDLPDVQDGLIGTDVFEEFLVTLDFAARKLRLDPLAGYHRGDGEPQDRAIAPEMRTFTRVFRFGHMLLVPTRVSNSREVQFVIDTGSARTLISYDLAEEVSKLNPDGQTGLRGLSGKVADVYQTGDLFLQFAGFRQKNLGMTSIDLWDQSRRLGTEVSGFLGLPVLSLFTLTIDYRDGLVNFDRKQP